MSEEADTAFARLFAAHAAQLFDYCSSLTSSEAVAADATRAALAAGQHLPRAWHLVRARLFAVARREALAITHAGFDLRPDSAECGADAPGRAVVAVLSHLPPGYREVLALVYRHGIWPEQLPAVLGVSAWEAYERLAAAEQDFVIVAAELDPVGTHLVGCPALEDMAAVPLLELPRLVWPDPVAHRRVQTARMPASPATTTVATDGGVRARTRSRLRLLTAGAVVPAAAIGCWALAAGAGPAHPAGALGADALPVISTGRTSPSSAVTPDSASPAPARQSTEPVQPGTAPTVPILTLLPSTPAGTVLPVATPTPSSGSTHPVPPSSPSASAAPSSSTEPSSSAEPSPSPSSVTPSPTASPTSSDSPSPSGSSPAASPTSSPSPSDSASVPTPSP